MADRDASSGDYRYYLHDHLGSSRALYDSSKNELARLAYTPYGEGLYHTGTADTTRRYTGHIWDETAQLLLPAPPGAAPYRYYNPNAARWLTRDPLGMVDGPNLYGYVGGDPGQMMDPLGLSFLSGIKRGFKGWCGQMADGAVGVWDLVVVGDPTPSKEAHRAGTDSFLKWANPAKRLRSDEYACQTFQECMNECLGGKKLGSWFGGLGKASEGVIPYGSQAYEAARAGRKYYAQSCRRQVRTGPAPIK
jgi:RHS repeat-associated protein